MENSCELGRFGRIATAASVVCAVECAGRPFALLLLPLFGIKLFDSEILEIAIIALVFVLGFGNIVHGFITRHQNMLPMIVFLAGFAALTIAHFVIDEESVFGFVVALTGVFLIAASQFLNRRAARDCCEFHKTLEGSDG